MKLINNKSNICQMSPPFIIAMKSVNDRLTSPPRSAPQSASCQRSFCALQKSAASWQVRSGDSMRSSDINLVS